MTHTIKVTPLLDESLCLLSEPTPSQRFVPDWYKKMSGEIDPTHGDAVWQAHEPQETNFTVKRCIPFLDSLTEGFSIALNHDVEIVATDTEATVRSKFFKKVPSDLSIGAHPGGQMLGAEIPNEYLATVALKWINNFVIETPPGYSISFDHPKNRFDLPFYTLSGVVDTDMYPSPVNFPFLVKKNTTVKILAGTPIVQLTVFKRDIWNLDKQPLLPTAEGNKILESVSSKQPSAYKNHYWHKKKK